MSAKPVFDNYRFNSFCVTRNLVTDISGYNFNTFFNLQATNSIVLLSFDMLRVYGDDKN